MIPAAAITEWSNRVPWADPYFVEQDLVINRCLVSLFQDDFLASRLAFRGGTALHKLYLPPQARYSSDIDLVQLVPEPIGLTLDRLKERVEFLELLKTRRKMSNNVLIFHYESETVPITQMKLKIEINCREHQSLLGTVRHPFGIESLWFTGSTEFVTYRFEELVGTKLRALYQRRKGRDLFDAFLAAQSEDIDIGVAIGCYRWYMSTFGSGPPTKEDYLSNLESKLADSAFRRDMKPLLGSGYEYDVDRAFAVVRDVIIAAM
jgi:predicted nucleotidyltransferase component of viral defense system